MTDDLDYERVLLVKPDIFIFRIPPRTSNRGFRAADWKLDQPDWTGRLRLVSKGRQCFIKLEEKTSGQLFAQCPVDQYPGIAIEPVADSSRYFVLRIVSDTGNTAFIGIGFADRGDSFDLNVALSDHFKVIEKEKEIEAEKGSEKEPPKLDLKFKEGETIKVILNIARPASSRKARPSPVPGVNSLGLLPPPPGSSKPRTIPEPTSDTNFANFALFPNDSSLTATAASSETSD